MRILLFPSAYSPHIGGVEELTHRLAVEYQQQGHSVQVVTARWPLNLSKYEVIQGVQVRRIDYVMPKRSISGILHFILHFPLRLIALALLIRRFKPDVVHIQCVSGQGFYLLILKKLLGFRMVVTLQGERRMDASQVYQRSRIMNPMLSKLLQTSNVVTACSQATLDDIADLWLAKNKGTVIPNGISLEEFDTGKNAKNGTPTSPYIFATGRQVYNKGFDLLIEAFNHVAGDFPDINLVIGGNGPEHQTLKDIVENSGLTHRIQLPGILNREQTVTCFNNCLFFVLPSRYEPFGIVNLEAMAAGKAVLATNVGGVSEVVLDGITGVLVAPENSTVLSDALTCLLDQPGKAELLGQAGRYRVEKEFTWKQIAEQYLEVYHTVLDTLPSN